MKSKASKGRDGARQVYTVAEAAQVLGIARGSAYQAIQRGELPSIRIGRRILVSRSGLEKILSSASFQAGKNPIRHITEID
jgi:excisionase family DNA binding protein